MMNMKGVLKMKRVGLLIVVTLFFIVALGISCGEDVTAPYTSEVEISTDDVDWEIACTSSCKPEFYGILVHYVTAVVTYGNKTAPVSSVDQPLNGVEITWLASSGDLWLPEDDYMPYYNNDCYLCSGPDDPNCPQCKNVLWPLAQPYDTETNDRGLSEVVWILWSPSDCDSTYNTKIWADIGVSTDDMQVTISVEACEEEQGGE